MLRAVLLSAVLRAMATVTDAHGYHFAVSQVGAEAITDAAIADPLWAGDEGQRETAYLLVVFGKHESGLNVNPRGSNDGGRACGPFQEHATGEVCLRLRRDWAFAAPRAIRNLRASMMINASHPWAAYAGSGLAAIRISDARSLEVKALLLAVPGERS